jgi:hypothetical protein
MHQGGVRHFPEVYDSIGNVSSIHVIAADVAVVVAAAMANVTIQ